MTQLSNAPQPKSRKNLLVPGFTEAFNYADHSTRTCPRLEFDYRASAHLPATPLTCTHPRRLPPTTTAALRRRPPRCPGRLRPTSGRLVRPHRLTPSALDSDDTDHCVFPVSPLSYRSRLCIKCAVCRTVGQAASLSLSPSLSRPLLALRPRLRHHLALRLALRLASASPSPSASPSVSPSVSPAHHPRPPSRPLSLSTKSAAQRPWIRYTSRSLSQHAPIRSLDTFTATSKR